MIKHVALFAGMGGFMYATQKCGIETVWANELDSKCCDSLKLNFPETPISSKSIAELDKVDVAEIPQHRHSDSWFPLPVILSSRRFQSLRRPSGEIIFRHPKCNSAYGKSTKGCPIRKRRQLKGV